MLHNNKQFIIHHNSLLGLSTQASFLQSLSTSFFFTEPQIDHFHIKLGYFKPTGILSLLKINFISTKLYEPNFNLPGELANQFSKFAPFANFFRWQFYSCKVVRR